MKFTPYEYQDLILDHVLGLPRSAVWAGMGMGKTVSVLSAYDYMLVAGEITRPLLVVAPKRVAVSTWPAEVEKWDHLNHLDVSPIVGTPKQRKAAMAKDVPVHTINYDNLVWFVDQFRTWPYGMVAADESTKLQGFRLRGGGRRARALGRIAKATPRWVNMTGTPAPNGYEGLWGQTWFLDRGERLGETITAYRENYFTENRHGGYDLIDGADQLIQARLHDLCLTVMPEDYFDLDEPKVNVIEVDLPPAVRAEYRRMEASFFAELGPNGISAPTAAVRDLKCRQLCNGFAFDEDRVAHLVHDEKLQALGEVMDETPEPVLVAYHFVPDRDRILETFPQARLLDEDPQTIRDWNAGKIPMLVAHPASCGHGLNLQDGGRTLVFYGVDWNLEYHDQIIERIGPMRQKQSGHDRVVFLHYILARDTLDQVVLNRLTSKRSVQDCLVDAMKRRAK